MQQFHVFLRRFCTETPHRNAGFLLHAAVQMVTLISWVRRQYNLRHKTSPRVSALKSIYALEGSSATKMCGEPSFGERKG